MKSISSKFIIVALAGILLCALFVGGAGLWAVSSAQNTNANQIMRLTCREEAALLNMRLQGIHSSVDIFAEAMTAQLRSIEALSDPGYTDKLLQDAEALMVNIAQNTPGICTHYMRIAPELASLSAGFFYTRKDAKSDLAKETLTDLSQFDPEDTEHVGWYYQPYAAGAPIWMDPYYNKNLDIYMVSYVVPLYLDGVFWGVAGMDIDFDVVIDAVRGLTPYETGYAFLASEEGVIQYHPTLPTGALIAEYAPELSAMIDLLRGKSDGEALDAFTYHYQGEEKKLTCVPLHNGMILMLTVESSEINAPQSRLFNIITLAIILLSIAAVCIVIPIANRITRPLQALKEAAAQIAQGNLEAELPVGTDEIGVLSQSLANTIRSLQEYITSITNKAYTDTLTGFKNKSFFEISMDKLSSRMKAGAVEYALLSLKLFGIRKINEEFGRNSGDEYLLNCSRMLSGIFKRSPIFRIDSVEFTVLLENADYDEHEKLIAEMENAILDSQSRKDPWERLNMAWGVGYCHPNDPAPQDILKRAQEEMNKKIRCSSAADDDGP